MKQFPLKHGSWCLITIGAFFWGLSDPGPPSAEGGEVGKIEPQTEQGPSDFPRQNAGSIRNTGNSGERFRESHHQRAIREGVADSMTKEQIQSLANGALKSGTLLDRRRGLDKILRGIQNAEISFADALAIREAMRAQDADKEGKLLDYAIGAYMSEEAIAHLDKLPAEERIGFLNGMIPGLASTHPAEAIGLFESLAPELQAQVRPGFLEGLVDHGVEMATDYLYNSSDLENYHWKPMAELTREVVRDQGLQPTLDWANELPQGPQRRDAWSAAYAVWASKDPTAAANSINALPDGTDRNLAINGFVSAHVHRDGPLAMDWAMAITEPVLREAAMVRIGTQFYQRDPESASQWYASSEWSPASWAKITNSAERKW